MPYSNDRNRNGIPDDKEGRWFRDPRQIPTTQYGSSSGPTGTRSPTPTYPTNPTVTTGSGGGRRGGSATNGGGLDGQGDWGYAGDIAGWLRGLITGPGSDGQGNFGAAGDAAGKLKEHGGAALGAGALAAAIWQALEADKLRKKGLEYATGAYDERTQMRTAGMTRAMNPQAAVPDLRQRFQTMGHNPYRQGARSVPGPAAGPPMPGSLPPVVPNIPTGRPRLPVNTAPPSVPSVPRPQWPGAPRPWRPLTPED